MRTESYYSRSNSLSYTHERSAQGHGDLADAVVSAIFYASQREEGRPKIRVIHWGETSGDPKTDLLFSEDPRIWNSVGY